MIASIHDTRTKLHLTHMKYLNQSEESPNKDKSVNKDEDVTYEALRNKKNRLSRLIEANVTTNNFMFITLTLDKMKVKSRTDLVELKKNWELFVKRFRYQFAEFQYIAVPETHIKGGWHIHFICLGLNRINYNELRDCWGLGRVHVSNDVPIHKAGYIAKYLGKFWNEHGLSENYKKGDRLIWRSRGLKEGEKFLINTTSKKVLAEKVLNRKLSPDSDIKEFNNLVQNYLDSGMYEIEHDTDIIINENCAINRYVRLRYKGEIKND